MATKQGKTPSYPPYRLYTYPNKDLCILRGHHIYDSDGVVSTVNDYDELRTFLQTHDALLFVENFAPGAFPFLAYAVSDRTTKIPCTKRGVPTSVRIALGKNRVGTITSCRTWTERPLDATFLKQMDDIYSYFKVGVHSTPAALGYALQLKSYTDNTLSSHFAPNRMAQKFLWTHHTGGRCDVCVPLYGKSNIIYPITYELDMATAYGAHSLIHPDGTSCSAIKEGAWEFATFFVECIVTLPYELPLGPFPIRQGNGHIQYPQKKGVYRAFLWREQIEDCLKVGAHVRIIKGYGWRGMTEDNALWARSMYAFRQQTSNEVLQNASKSATVGGHGRHGMHNRFHSLVDRPLSDEDVCMIDPDTFEAMPYFIHASYDYAKPAMTHWYGYTLMQTARSLYHYSVPYAENGTLLMTNYDALLIETENPPDGMNEKHTLAGKMCELGDLRYQKLTNVKVLASRNIDCTEKPTKRRA